MFSLEAIYYDMKEKSCILFCRYSAGVISRGTLSELSAGLKLYDTDVFELQDLCALTLNEKEFFDTIEEKFDRKIIIACFPRAVKNMLRQGGIDLGDYEVLNFRENSSAQIFSTLETVFQIPRGDARYHVQVSDLDVPAWFPVIDESRCNLCGKCARFCLFGVYSFSKRHLKVVNPLSCKDKCPACGRTCPTQAIIFPRLDEQTVLAGAMPGKAGVAVDQGSLLASLNQRNQNRRNIFRQGMIQQAEEERKKALEEFKAIKGEGNE